MSTAIQNKTIRPGTLRYTYYRSGKPAKAQESSTERGHLKGILLTLIVLITAYIIYGAVISPAKPASNSASRMTKATSITPAPPTKKTTSVPAQTTKTSPGVTTQAATNPCAANTLDKLILVSLAKQQLWACNMSSQAYNSAVVTGDEQHADTITPVGTYHIYAKETDRRLTGSDENGRWNDFVYYWMPFLYNQYGAYGLHDATWRADNAFGNISPNSSEASNGCVELPLATAKWLYDWSSVGTTITIEN